MNTYNLPPYELGILNRPEVIDSLIPYLQGEDINNKIESALTIQRLAKYYSEDCAKTIPFLIANFSHEGSTLRWYMLKTLAMLSVPVEYYNLIKQVAENPKESNRNVALAVKILQRIKLDVLHIHRKVILKKSKKSNQQFSYKNGFGENNTRGFVYFLKEKAINKYVKIGATKNINRRIKDLGVKLFCSFSLLGYVVCDDYFEAERAFHEFFKQKRIKGEWFELTSEDIFWINAGQFPKEISKYIRQTKSTF